MNRVATSCRVSLNGRPIETSRKEFDLLVMLASKPRQMVTRSALMEQIWDGSWPSRTLDTHVNTLRRKLGGGEWITTVRGIGFRFVGDGAMKTA
ncbi:response regulator transcription factor [Nocardia sp. BSTN01]|uniref:winged helix-turn-helix domain-containing protein n=1 Tax=Nocardia sp. BSTN01 TaxID=2783665 RepID=UPI00281618B3|nr:response regulator transcription factor [Nocardia sp. BSTN01]